MQEGSEKATALSPQSELRVETVVTNIGEFIADFGERPSLCKDMEKEQKESVRGMPQILEMV